MKRNFLIRKTENKPRKTGPTPTCLGILQVIPPRTSLSQDYFYFLWATVFKWEETVPGLSSLSSTMVWLNFSTQFRSPPRCWGPGKVIASQAEREEL